MWLLIPLLVLVALAVAAVIAAGLLIAGVGWIFFGILHHLPFLLVIVGVWLLFRARGPRHQRAWSGGPGTVSFGSGWKQFGWPGCRGHTGPARPSRPESRARRPTRRASVCSSTTVCVA